MGCGCNKRSQRRAQVVKTVTPRTAQINSNPAGTVEAGNQGVVNAQGGATRRENLNQGGVSAEKRKIQAMRRNEILKKLGKR